MHNLCRWVVNHLKRVPLFLRSGWGHDLCDPYPPSGVYQHEGEPQGHPAPNHVMPGAPCSSSPPHIRNPGAPFSSPPPAPPQLENCDPFAGYGFRGAATVDGTTHQTADAHSAAYMNNNVVRVAPDEAAAQLPLQASGALAHLSLIKAQILMLNIVYKNEGSKQLIPRAVAYMIWHQLKCSKPSFVTLLSGMQLRQMRQATAHRPWQLIYGPWPSAWRLSPGALPA